MPFRDIVESSSHCRLKQHRVIDRQHQPLLSRLGNHEVAFFHRFGERLFDEDVAAHLERLERKSTVRDWRCENVHHLRVRRGHIRQSPEKARYAEAGGQRRSPCSIDVADAYNLDKR